MTVLVVIVELLALLAVAWVMIRRAFYPYGTS